MADPQLPEDPEVSDQELEAQAGGAEMPTAPQWSHWENGCPPGTRTL